MRRLILRAFVALGTLTPFVSPAQDACKSTADATKVPAVSALLDSAKLIANLPAPNMAAAKEVFVRVTTGSTPRAVVLDTVTAKTESGRVLAERILASLKPNAKDLMPAFRLKVLLGEAPALAVLPAADCPPKGRSALRSAPVVRTR